MRVLVTGAGGFIGGHLVKRLLDEGYEVRAVDIKPLRQDNGEEGWWQIHPNAENIGGLRGDLREPSNCFVVCDGVDEVYNLACMMGGIGFIEEFKAECAESVVINPNLFRAVRACNVKRFFYSSSACVYAGCVQDDPNVVALKEADAYPDRRADPEDGYGWEKLYSERLCRHEYEDHGIETRVARFHNIYGPNGSWTGGKEKAPAAICRKVAEAVQSGKHTIDVWGDGTFTRSFCWIDDCVEGIRAIMKSDIREPINLGSAEQVTVDQLVSVVEDIASVKLQRIYDTSKPQGVPGRNSDNTMILERLGWEPTTSLQCGLGQTYDWIANQVRDQ